METDDIVDALGVLRIDATGGGQLARLSSLVAWLATRDELPLQGAVNAVLDRLDASKAPFYRTIPGQYAHVTDREFVSMAEGGWFAFALSLDDDATEEEIRAAVVSDLRLQWGSITSRSDLGALASGRYAILLSTACALFGFGADTSTRPVSVAPLHLVKEIALTGTSSMTPPAVATGLSRVEDIQAPAALQTIGDRRRKHDKSPAEVLAMHVVMKSDGKGSETKRLAAQLGITVRQVQLILKKANADTAPLRGSQLGGASSVFAVAGRKVL